MPDQPPRREPRASPNDSDPEWVLYEEDWLSDEEVDTLGMESPYEPVAGPRNFREWTAAAVRGLLDIQFHQVATRTLLPLVYVLGLGVSVAVPVGLTVLMFYFSTVLGLLFLIFVAPLLGLTIAATVRLLLEFLVNTTRLASRVNHITVLADDLMQAMTEMAVPVSQLSEDFRAVQFWRFRQKKR